MAEKHGELVSDGCLKGCGIFLLVVVVGWFAFGAILWLVDMRDRDEPDAQQNPARPNGSRPSETQEPQPAVAPQTTSVAYKLTVVAGTRARDYQATETRFDFVVGRLDQICEDFESETRVADGLVATWNLLKEAGLDQEEGLLAMTNALHRLTSRVFSLQGSEVQCAQYWGLYASFRQQGNNPEEATGSLIALAETFFSP